MLIKNNLKIPTEIELFKSADKFTRERLWKLWFSSQVLVSKDIRNYLNLCHRYLRWVDDFVDDMDIGLREKKEFIQSQLILLHTIENEKDFEIHQIEEFDLYYLVQFALETKRELIIDEVKNTLKGLQNDVNRLGNDGALTEKELKELIRLQSESFCKIVNHFLLPGYIIPKEKIFDGAFYWYILAVRDFNEDTNAGFINISREEIEKFKLNIENLVEDERLYDWLKYKYPYIIDLLERDKVTLKTFPLKLKLFWVPGYFSFLYELIRVKEYGYKFGIKVKSEGLKEIIVFTKTLKFYIKFCFGVFIK